MTWRWHARLGALLLLLVGDANAQRRESQSLTALDVAEIEALYARSNLALDSGAEGGLAFARTFVSDGALHRDSKVVTGQRDLAALARNTPALRTWIGNLMIEPSAEGAVGWAYVLQIPFASAGDAPAASGGQTAVTEGGLYHDILVRTSAGWRFKTRTYTEGHGLPSARP